MERARKLGSEGDRGLIPRICETLFQKMVEGTKYRVEVSYLEIYNEKVKDLLKKGSTHNLKVREHPTTGPYVQDLSKHFFNIVAATSKLVFCMIACP